MVADPVVGCIAAASAAVHAIDQVVVGYMAVGTAPGDCWCTCCTRVAKNLADNESVFKSLVNLTTLMREAYDESFATTVRGDALVEQVDVGARDRIS